MLVDAALALLMLLKPRFLAARDFAECKHVRAPDHYTASFTIREASSLVWFSLAPHLLQMQVFLFEPSKLYTADFMKAWIHLQRGGNPLLVPDMNRQHFIPFVYSTYTLILYMLRCLFMDI